MRTGVALVLGGSRSGKSAYGERLAMESGLERVYIATARPGDEEMAKRIAEHRARRDDNWRTVEAHERLESALAAEAGEGKAVLIDCLTVWLSNIMLIGADAEARTAALCEAARRADGLVVLVSNEVGLGIVPETALGRQFRDLQGRLNQAIAALSDRVVFMAAGLPLYLKGGPE